MRSWSLIFFFSIFAVSSVWSAEVTGLNSINRAVIVKVEPTRINWEAQVTLRMPSNIGLQSWVECVYYNDNNEVVATTAHVLNVEEPTWSVAASAANIAFVLCEAQ